MPEFNFDTISHFDKHISGSINGYILLDNLIMNICSFYAKDGETIVDLGCTSGRLISKLAKEYPHTHCIGYDITQNNFYPSTHAELIVQDITKKNFIIPQANIILSVFTLQFLQYKDRMNVLEKVYNSLNYNGVFILCEKELCGEGIFQEVFTFANYDYKKFNFTAQEILEKEKDLRKIMNCLTHSENEFLLKKMKFTRIEQFFQSLNFKGWLCMK
jgi:tRNA (cmo5U34)-methyltransferase